MKKQWRSVLTVFASSIFWLSSAQADISQRADVQVFIDEMVSEQGFSEEELTELFEQVDINQSLIDLMTRPAERKPWYEYKPLFVTNMQAINGVKFWRDNQAALEKAEQEYGVPAEIIVAIIGVETRYGTNKGSHSVLEALSTFAFEYPSRSEFFTKELKEYLILTREEGIDPTVLVGSYAGAMGTPQFMPSSYRAYAVDFTNDGKRDLWENNTDAIGSVANYFKRHGWEKNAPVAYLAQVDGNGVNSIEKNALKPNTSVEVLESNGIAPLAEIKLNDDEMATLLELELDDGHEYWIGLNNFYVITRYNHSVLYAMAVYQLSEKLAQLKQQSS